jgi:hypothetical protein
MAQPLGKPLVAAGPCPETRIPLNPLGANSLLAEFMPRIGSTALLDALPYVIHHHRILALCVNVGQDRAIPVEDHDAVTAVSNGPYRCVGGAPYRAVTFCFGSANPDPIWIHANEAGHAGLCMRWSRYIAPKGFLKPENIHRQKDCRPDCDQGKNSGQIRHGE